MSAPPARGRFHLHGRVLPDDAERDVWIADGRFLAEPVDDAVTLATDAVLLPGLVDAHAHLALHSPAPPSAGPDERIRASGRAQLEAGVTLVREPGSPDPRTTGLGPADGMPRLQTAGHLLTPPGTYIEGIGRPVPDERLPEVAEAEARRGGGWVKVIGDFVGRDGRLSPHYAPATVAAAAARVHAAGARMAIHANLAVVIEAAIEAGIDSLEHATYLAPSHVPELLRRGTAVVPTLLIRDRVMLMVQRLGMPPEEVGEFLAAYGRLPGTVRFAAGSGVTVLAGTDAGMVPHGRVRDEVEHLLAAGLDPVAAIGAASWVARRYLGLPGIEPGAPADVVAFARDPRTDPAVLGEPLRIVLDGRLVR